MAEKPDYQVGLATLAAGGTTVTFTGGANITAADIKPGDTLKVQNLDAIIAEVTDSTHVELTAAWTGAALAAAPYRIRYQPDGSRYTSAVRDLIDRYGNVDIPSITMGPASASNNNLAAYNGTTGKLQKDSGISITDLKPDEYIGPVATGTMVLHAYTTANKQMMSRTLHKARDSISYLQVGFPNWYVDSSSEVNPGQTATITASIEYPAGIFTRLTFSGSVTGNITDGATLISDNRLVNIPDGAEFWVRAFYTGSAGVTYTTAAGDFSHQCAFAVSGLVDMTMGGTIPDAVGGATYLPCLIIGKTRKPSVALLGDSRMWGVATDTQDITTHIGTTMRSLGPYYAMHNIARSGEMANQFIASHAKRLPIAQYASHAVVAYGINDIRTGIRTAAQVKADTETIIGYFPGKKVFVNTLEPNTTSTDGWVTGGNQTVGTYESVRVAYNNMVRAGLVGAAGYFDIADAVEYGRNSGMWLPALLAPGGTAITGDGLHCNQNGYWLIRDKGVINPDAFKVAGTKSPKAATPTEQLLGTSDSLFSTPLGTGLHINAAFQSGEDVNGRWVRYPDGTQICHARGVSTTTTIALATLFRSSIQTFTFPMPFIATPQVAPGNSSSSGLCWTYTQAISGSAVGIGLIGTAATDAGIPHYTAVGKWK